MWAPLAQWVGRSRLYKVGTNPRLLRPRGRESGRGHVLSFQYMHLCMTFVLFLYKPFTQNHTSDHMSLYNEPQYGAALAHIIMLDTEPIT